MKFRIDKRSVRVVERAPSYTTGWAGRKYDLHDIHRYANATILMDVGQAKSVGAVANLRRHYAHIVGGTFELKQAAEDLWAQARANGLVIRDNGKWLKGLKRPVREKSLEGRLVDYVIWNKSEAVGPVEWGRKYDRWDGTITRRTQGAFPMANAAKGLGPNGLRFKDRGGVRADIKRK